MVDVSSDVLETNNNTCTVNRFEDRICSPISVVEGGNIHLMNAEKGLLDTIEQCFFRNCDLALEKEYVSSQT